MKEHKKYFKRKVPLPVEELLEVEEDDGIKDRNGIGQ